MTSVAHLNRKARLRRRRFELLLLNSETVISSLIWDSPPNCFLEAQVSGGADGFQMSLDR
jgi:hypothetical protein